MRTWGAVFLAACSLTSTGCGLLLDTSSGEEPASGEPDAGLVPGSSDGGSGGSVDATFSTADGAPIAADAETADAGSSSTGGDEEDAGLDSTLLPSGCPENVSFTTTPPRYSFRLMPYAYDADVDAPDPVVWSLAEAPEGMTVDALGVVRWAPSAYGVFHVVLVAQACSQTVTQAWDITSSSVLINGLSPAALIGSRIARDPALRREIATTPISSWGSSPSIAAASIEDSESAALLATLERCAVAIGLAPEWRERACDDRCRAWVSACTFALVNADGEHVAVDLRGDHPSLAGARPNGFVREGAFWGDFFAAEPIMHACASEAAARVPSRRCTRADGGCAMQVTGACGDAPSPRPRVDVWLPEGLRRPSR